MRLRLALVRLKVLFEKLNVGALMNASSNDQDLNSPTGVLIQNADAAESIFLNTNVMRPTRVPSSACNIVDMLQVLLLESVNFKLAGFDAQETGSKVVGSVAVVSSLKCQILAQSRDYLFKCRGSQTAKCRINSKNANAMNERVLYQQYETGMYPSERLQHCYCASIVTPAQCCVL